MITPKKQLILCLIAGLASGAISAKTPDVVRTAYGDLQGFLKKVPETQLETDVFLGVPYASPVTGDKRWTKAQPPRKWEGIRSADRAPQPCRQNSIGSEDCLYVNIYRPAGTKPDAKLPVGVYAHGGANIVGNASDHDGARIAAENGVIIVTVQYRMGAFGFLRLPGMDPETAGNFGVSDTEEALRWVKANIAAFGGDGNKVTLMSESAGSTNACRILVDTKFKGGVDAVMLQSEDCLHDVDTTAQSKERADKFLALTGCDQADDKLACVRKLSGNKIAEASAAVGWWNPVSDVPAVTAIAKGDWIKVPVLTGSNKEEGRAAGAAYIGWTEADYKAWVKKLLGENAEAGLAQYPISRHTGKYALEYTMGDFITDSGMRGLGGCTNMTLSEALAKAGTPVFWYSFEDSAIPTAKKQADYDNAASHAAELTYLFPDAGSYFALSQKMNSSQQKLARDMRAYWANFVRNHNPNGKGLAQWKPFKSDNGFIMALRLDGKSRSEPAKYFSELHRCSFWRSIPIVLDRGDR